MILFSGPCVDFNTYSDAFIEGVEQGVHPDLKTADPNYYGGNDTFRGIQKVISVDEMEFTSQREREFVG